MILTTEEVITATLKCITATTKVILAIKKWCQSLKKLSKPQQSDLEEVITATLNVILATTKDHFCTGLDHFQSGCDHFFSGKDRIYSGLDKLWSFPQWPILWRPLAQGLLILSCGLPAPIECLQLTHAYCSISGQESRWILMSFIPFNVWGYYYILY